VLHFVSGLTLVGLGLFAMQTTRGATPMPQQPYRTQLSGWGRFPVVDGWQFKSENLPAITEAATLCRGLGRSYGDSSLPARNDLPVADTTLANRLISFNAETGALRAEAGTSLLELNRVFLRRGWFVPVSPGTQYVTFGGMVASDVHGKNHHVDGCFGEHVRSLKMRVADGRILECSDEQERELFRATIGGMGLTGHILEVEFTMRRITSPWIWGESERISDLDAMIAGLKQAAKLWPMTVGWVDCLARGAKLGRGILMKGRWANACEAPERPPSTKRSLRIPFAFPSLALCRPSMKAFNLAYYWKHFQKVRRGIVHPSAFFYPLDALDDWNLVYGKRGFTQYQCVLPKADDNGPARRFLEKFVSAGGMGFLCVIKDCGAEGKGMLSFPRPGISIAMDFPVHRKKTPVLVDQLNELVIAEGGRIYLTKDALTRPEHFRAMEPRVDAFNAVRRQWDPDVRIRSAQSVRLLGDPA
jgi:FAD/FMN-containing dehydrogenase